MKTIKEIVGTPSRALEYMCDGLLRQSKRKAFRIAMNTYGAYNHDKRLCFGCAATCAIQEIMGKNIPGKFLEWSIDRSGYFGLSNIDLKEFETAIDMASRSLFRRLFRYFDRDFPVELNLYSFNLETSNWRKELPKVRKLIEDMKKAGL